jgi:predicted TIM-barrel fold metal-dependent hydrolase
MRIVDAHHHLWGLKRNVYPWLRPKTAHLAGDLAPICNSYLLPDFLADAQGQELAKSAHVQAEIDRVDPVKETAWLQALADDPASGGSPHGIIAFADLADAGVESVLERHCRYPNVRGVRYLLDYEEGEPLYCAATRGDWLPDDRWRAGYALLGKYRLSFDLQIWRQQMADAAELAHAFPDTLVILNHTGMPRSRGPAYVADWRQSVQTLAQAPNVAVKISGLPMFHHDWTPELIRPLVLDTIEIFGTGRCMFASAQLAEPRDNFARQQRRSSCGASAGADLGGGHGQTATEPGMLTSGMALGLTDALWRSSA